MAFINSARTGAIGALLLAACASSDGTGSKIDFTGTGNDGTGNGSGVTLQASVTTLVADQAGVGNSVSSSLINAWGIVGYQGWFWIANEGTGKVSILDGAGKPSTKPASDAIDLGEGITGVAINDSTAMQIHNDTTCGPANLIFASVHGQLIGVNTDLSTTGGFVLVDNSKTAASYTGVATIHSQACSQGTGTGVGDHTGSTGDNGSGQDNGQGNCQTAGSVLTLAADFHNARLDVFDESFKLLDKPMFTVPDLPADFAPFNVMVFSGTIFVAYAKQDETKTEEEAGPGLGLVAAFDVSGKLLWTAKGDELNAPWGMALTGDLALFPGVLLVGNFGDGRITALDPASGKIMSQLMDTRGAPLEIDGLWGITLGIGVQNAMPGALYFAAGPDEEMHGTFGLVAVPST